MPSIMALSVFRGRCGPCCSVAERGRMATESASSAQSADLSSDQYLDDVPMDKSPVSVQRATQPLTFIRYFMKANFVQPPTTGAIRGIAATRRWGRYRRFPSSWDCSATFHTGPERSGHPHKGTLDRPVHDARPRGLRSSSQAIWSPSFCLRQPQYWVAKDKIQQSVTGR